MLHSNTIQGRCYGNAMRFLAKTFKHNRIPNSYAAYVPKNTILFYGVDPKEYADRWHLAGAIRVRLSPYKDFTQTPGDVGHYASRNTLRIQFLHNGDDISGRILEFWISQERFETSDS